MEFFNQSLKEVISTGILFFIVFIARVVATKLIRRYAKFHQKMEKRTNLVIKYIHIFITILTLIILILIWGVQPKDIFVTLSSIATVIGVAMFAQWSILSNITSGIILFFYFPFKIGDMIFIHDKDYEEEGEIEDIGAFHVTLKSTKGELVIYPNNLFFQKGISVVKKSSSHDNSEFMD